MPIPSPIKLYFPVQLKQAIKDQNRTIDSDAMSLLDEIDQKNRVGENKLDEESDDAGPPPGGPPNEPGDHAPILHSIPHKQSQPENET